MSRNRILSIAIAAVVGIFSIPASAEAGPLLDWLCGRRNRQVVYRQPRTLLRATPGTFTQAPTYLQPGQCQRTCMQTRQRVVVNYVPYTDYRTHWAKIPVTQYRPVTTQDPRTGCVVTCMKPCVNYTWQLQRTPYTTYRPVYRTMNYKVPVTTITNNCATGNCGVPTVGASAIGGILPAANNGCVGCNVPSNTPFINNQVIPPASTSGGSPADQIPQLPSAFNHNRNRNVSFRRPLPEQYSQYSGSQNGGETGYNNQLHGTGYGQPEYRPSPSGRMAPVPAFGGAGEAKSQNTTKSPAGELLPADKVPVLEDDDNIRTRGEGLGQPKSVLQRSTVQPIRDPAPEKRWNLQASNAPLVSLAGNPAVFKPWGYQPVKTSTAFSKVNQSVNQPTTFENVNDQWQ